MAGETRMMTIIPPAKCEKDYALFGPIFGGYLAPYLDLNIGAGCGYVHPDAEAGVLNLNTGRKFMVDRGSLCNEHYSRLVRQLTQESAHLDGKEIERMTPDYLVISNGNLFAMVTL